MSHKGFLTRIANITLPYPPMDKRLLLGIEEGLRVAWENLLSDPEKHGFMFVCKEVEITADLELELEKILYTKACDSFSELVFSVPKRIEAFNYNGKKLAKKPDLTFWLRDRRPGIEISAYDAVFAECKIVFNDSRRNVGLYVTKGLKRFLEGDYAWAMPHALMIGYVRTTQQLPDPLVDYFFHKRTGKKMNSDVYQLEGNTLICEQPISRMKSHVCQTVHRRNWGYPPNESRKPGNITIRHLWLSLNR